MLRKCMLLGIPLTDLLDVLEGRMKVELPEGAVLTTAHWNHECNALDLVVHHPSFLESKPGHLIPRGVMTILGSTIRWETPPGEGLVGPTHSLLLLQKERKE